MMVSCYSNKVLLNWIFPGDAMVKNPPVNAGDTKDVALIPELGRSPGGGNDNLL